MQKEAILDMWPTEQITLTVGNFCSVPVHSVCGHGYACPNQRTHLSFPKEQRSYNRITLLITIASAQRGPRTSSKRAYIDQYAYIYDSEPRNPDTNAECFLSLK